MDNENVTNPAEAPATEEVAAEEETTSEQEAPETEADESAAEGEGAEPETEEVEINGNRYKVPKELAPHLMMNKDYTHKTQALAEERRQWEAQRIEEEQRIQRESEITQAVIDDEAQLRAVDARLKWLSSVDPYSLSPQDYQRYSIDLQQARQAKEDLSHSLNLKKEALSADRQQNFAKAVSKAIENLNQPDERLGWAGKYDESVRENLTQAAKEIGIPDHMLQGIAEPAVVKAIHLAKIGLETLKKQKAAATAKPASPPANPVPTVSAAKTKPVVNPDKLTTEQWVKWREKQIAKQRA